MRRLLRETDVVPGVAGVGVLLGATFALGLPVAAGLGAGAAVYLGVRWLLPDPDPEVAPGLTRSRHLAALAGFEQRIAAVVELGGQAPKPAVRARVDALTAAASRITAHVRDDPADLVVARPLLELYLDAAATILRTYVRLASRPVDSAREPLAKAEDEALPLLHQRLTDLYEHLQREEVVALTVDSELIEFRTHGIT